jgi:hypothetical protein
MNTDPGYYRHGCTGPCNQGDLKCPCPQSCFIRVEEEDPHAGFGALFWPVVAFAVVLALWLLAGVLA